MNRTKYQGLVNVLEFNLPKYILGFLVGIMGLFLLLSTNNSIVQLFALLSQISWLLILVSLVVSHWIYDISSLYKLEALTDIELPENAQIVNVSAGFDEIGDVLKIKYSMHKIEHLDIFKSLAKKEISIKLAQNRKLRDSKIQVEDFKIPFESDSKDLVILFFAAHEIRDSKSRILFFKEIRRVLKGGGRVLITEHQRDLNNFLAYTLGFYHFYPQKTWLKLFKTTGFRLQKTRKENPWVKTFKIQKI